MDFLRAGVLPSCSAGMREMKEVKKLSNIFTRQEGLVTELEAIGEQLVQGY